MKIRAVVVAIAVSVLLVSCGDTEEVAVEEPGASLSAEEIVQLVLDAGRSIDSIRVEEDRVADDNGEHTQTHSLYIRVGEDSYEKYDGDERIHNEVLTYGGVEYFRDEDGTWAHDGSYAVIMHTIEYEGSSGWDEALLSETYGIDFNQYRDAEVLAERTMDGRQVIGLASESTTPIDDYFDDLESQVFPPGMDIPDDFREQLMEDLAKQPDTIWSKQVVWVGVDDYRVYRVETESKGYRDEAVVASSTTTQTYSLFNEAELPGPLPGA